LLNGAVSQKLNGNNAAPIGVARILSGGALFFPEKVDDLFNSRRPKKTAKTA